MEVQTAPAIIITEIETLTPEELDIDNTKVVTLKQGESSQANNTKDEEVIFIEHIEEDTESNSSGNTCNICFEEKEEKILLKCCNHEMCRECFNATFQSLETTTMHCPYCRKQLHKKFIIKNLDRKRVRLYVSRQVRENMPTEQSMSRNRISSRRDVEYSQYLVDNRSCIHGGITACVVGVFCVLQFALM